MYTSSDQFFLCRFSLAPMDLRMEFTSFGKSGCFRQNQFPGCDAPACSSSRGDLLWFAASIQPPKQEGRATQCSKLQDFQFLVALKGKNQSDLVLLYIRSMFFSVGFNLIRYIEWNYRWSMCVQDKIHRWFLLFEFFCSPLVLSSLQKICHPQKLSHAMSMVVIYLVSIKLFSNLVQITVHL